MKDVIERGWQERTVNVDRLELLDTLKENRKKHQEAYRESVQGYRSAAMDTLKSQVARAQKLLQDKEAMIAAKIERFDPEDPMDSNVEILGQVLFRLEVPKDHTKSYDVAIAMAEWEVEDRIELTQSQFQCFVLDDWDWKSRFDHLNKTYSAVGAR